MSTWSRSLSSLIASNKNSMLSQQKMLSSNKNLIDNDDDSLTDVSVPIQARPSARSNHTTHDPLFQSLIAYANSFNHNDTIYSIQNFRNSSDYHSDETTTISNRSKFDWENLHSNKTTSSSSSSKIIKKLNKIHFEKKIPSSIIIREKVKRSPFLRHDIDLQIVRPTTPIIVREILPKPSSSNTLNQRLQPSKPLKYQINTQSLDNILIEYDQINVNFNKNIQQCQSSLYSKEFFNQFYFNN